MSVASDFASKKPSMEHVGGNSGLIRDDVCMESPGGLSHGHQLQFHERDLPYVTVASDFTSKTPSMEHVGGNSGLIQDGVSMKSPGGTDTGSETMEDEPKISLSC